MPTRQELIDGLNRAAAAGDNIAANEIAEMLDQMDKAAAPAPQPNETYLEGVKRRYQEADFGGITAEFAPEMQRRMDITRQAYGADVTPMEATQTAISQAARTGGELVAEAAGVIIPDVVKEIAGDAWDMLAKSTYGKVYGVVLSKGYDEYQQFKQDNPAEAEQLESAIDVAAVFSPRPDLINLDKKALAAKEAGNLTKINKEKTAVTSMLQPEKLTVEDVTEPRGLLKTETWVPNSFDETVIDAVMTIPGLKPYGTIHHNFRVMQRHVDNQGKALDNYVKSQNRKIDMEDLNFEFDAALDDFVNSDVYKLASEAAQKQFDKYVSLARDIINAEGNDLTGLLNARRRFDRAIQAAGQTLEADVATYQAKAGKLVRGVMNDYLKRNTRGDEVHHLLDQQFQTLTALDRMVNKRNAEGVNALARLKQNIAAGTGVALPTTVLSVLATGSLLVDPLAASLVGAAAAGTLVGQQIVRHGKATVLRAYAETLSATNKAIKAVNNPTQLQALELDRLVLIDMMNEAREYEEPKEND